MGITHLRYVIPTSMTLLPKLIQIPKQLHYLRPSIGKSVKWISKQTKRFAYKKLNLFQTINLMNQLIYEFDQSKQIFPMFIEFYFIFLLILTFFNLHNTIIQKRILNGSFGLHEICYICLIIGIPLRSPLSNESSEIIFLGKI